MIYCASATGLFFACPDGSLMMLRLATGAERGYQRLIAMPANSTIPT